MDLVHMCQWNEMKRMFQITDWDWDEEKKTGKSRVYEQQLWMYTSTDV